MSVRWSRATTPGCAFDAIARGATPVAGATALYSQAFAPRIGDTATLLAWPPAAPSAGGVDALTTLDALTRGDLPRAVRQAARAAANPSVRRLATVGGWVSLRSPASDIAAPLLAVAAHVRVLTAAGSIPVPYRDYLRAGPGEPHLVTSIDFDMPLLRSAYRRIPLRATPGPVLLGVAAARTPEVTRIAVTAGPHVVVVEAGADATTDELAEQLRPEFVRVLPRRLIDAAMRVRAVVTDDL